MIALLRFLLILFVSPFKSKSRLEAENAALRHQLIVPRCAAASPELGPPFAKAQKTHPLL
jgi:hypothetical protein